MTEETRYTKQESLIKTFFPNGEEPKTEFRNINQAFSPQTTVPHLLIWLHKALNKPFNFILK